MTTIAYRDGILAADSRATRAGWVLSQEVDKLHRLADGGVAAICGDPSEAMRYIEWLRTQVGERPKMTDASVIVLRPDRTIETHESGYFHTVTLEFCAWGSGGPAATAALMMGADALKAVEIASRIDSAHTGGPFRFMSIAPAKPATGGIAQLRDFTVD